MDSNIAPADGNVDVVPLEQLEDWPQETKDKVKAEYGRPCNGNTPRRILDAINIWETTTANVHQACKQAGVDYHGLHCLIHCDKTVATRWRAARVRKAPKYAERGAQMLAELPSEPQLYQADKVSGQPVLTGAAASLLQGRAKYQQWLAQSAETGSYIPSSRSEATSRNLHVSLAVTPAATGAELAGQLTDLLGL